MSRRREHGKCATFITVSLDLAGFCFPDFVKFHEEIDYEQGEILFVCAVRLKEIAQGLFMALKSLRFSDVFASHSDVVYFLISCRAWLPFIWRDLDLSARLNSCPATSR